MDQDYLITGLGNPGSKYEKTRHNLGFMVVEALAKKYGLNFKRGWRLQGRLASGVIEEKKIHLLMPTTYMNLSGVAVQKAITYYRVSHKYLLVVADDFYVKFGKMRLREEGGAGGHNGLASIESSLGTQNYSRLRMGVGPQTDTDLPSDQEIPLEKYVLAPFTANEQQLLPQVVGHGVSVIEAWLKQGASAASTLAGNISKLGYS